MSILIKGMEMPKDGSWVTLRVFPDGKCFLYSWCGNDFDFMEHLTAIPVPPHGRLIDADGLMREMPNVILEDGEDRRTFYSVIERQPTVIPADKEE